MQRFTSRQFCTNLLLFNHLVGGGLKSAIEKGGLLKTLQGNTTNRTPPLDLPVGRLAQLQCHMNYWAYSLI